MTLNDDLVQRARQYAPDLSSTVEALLAEFVERNGRLDQQISDYLAASDSFAARYGSLTDDFPGL